MSFQPNPPPDPAAQWRKIQHIGLCPGISSFEIYTNTYVPQLEQAINESIAVACLVPGLDEIRAFHKIVFNGIHEWAGTFRGAGESVNFDGGQIGADHHRIVPAIEKLQAETTTLIETSANIGEKVRAVVMYLGALRCIHSLSRWKHPNGGRHHRRTSGRIVRSAGTRASGVVRFQKSPSECLSGSCRTFG